jgi:putative FmdB family regulatory protein
MPLYEYQCQQCGLNYERLEHASALHNGTCPECGNVARRLIGAPALKFKGSGWYVNDYGKGQGSDSDPTENTKPPSEAKASDDAKKSTTKTEKKADTKVA